MFLVYIYFYLDLQTQNPSKKNLWKDLTTLHLYLACVVDIMAEKPPYDGYYCFADAWRLHGSMAIFASPALHTRRLQIE